MLEVLAVAAAEVSTADTLPLLPQAASPKIPSVTATARGTFRRRRTETGEMDMVLRLIKVRMGVVRIQTEGV